MISHTNVPKTGGKGYHKTQEAMRLPYYMIQEDYKKDAYEETFMSLT